jgi:hypothetical protein
MKERLTTGGAEASAACRHPAHDCAYAHVLGRELLVCCYCGKVCEIHAGSPKVWMQPTEEEAPLIARALVSSVHGRDVGPIAGVPSARGAVKLTLVLDEEDRANMPIALGYAVACLAEQKRRMPEEREFVARMIRRLEAMHRALADAEVQS